MSNLAGRVTSVQKDGQHSAEEKVSELPIVSSDCSGTSDNFDASPRYDSAPRSQEYYRRCYSDCGNLRVATSVRVTAPDDDNPPPYSALIPQNHATWSYELPIDSTQVRNATSLEQFQERLTSSNDGRCIDRTRPLSVDAFPSDAFWVYKEIPPRSISGNRSPENLRIAKVANLPRKYGTILIAVIVVVSMMALSLIVRLIVERRFWRG